MSIPFSFIDVIFLVAAFRAEGSTSKYNAKADRLVRLWGYMSSETRTLDGLITWEANLRGGRPIIAGTGVTVRTVVGNYKLGLAPEEIADEMELELASVYAAIAYYHLNRDEIEADIAANSEESLKGEFSARS